jgi:PTH1 family peptidyl-tRNA hydrolase
VLVILDDLDLPMGRIRFRAAGGSGGHNGLNSINQSLGTDSYARLRFGIGRPEGDTIDYVLTPFSPDETRVVNEGLVQAAEAIEAWIQHGIQYAMNHFN